MTTACNVAHSLRVIGMLNILFSRLLLILLLSQHNPSGYDVPTSVLCTDGIMRTVRGKVLWDNNRIYSAHALEPSVAFTPDGISIKISGDFELNHNGKLVRFHSTEEYVLFTPDGIGVRVNGYAQLSLDSRLVRAELAQPTTLIIPDGTGKEFIGFVRFDRSGRVTAGRLASPATFFRQDGVGVQVPAHQIVYLDEKGRLLYTRNTWDSTNEFEINRD